MFYLYQILGQTLKVVDGVQSVGVLKWVQPVHFIMFNVLVHKKMYTKESYPAIKDGVF